ncbi:sortase B protein-sorting domain-containing protein [Chryseobacterium sp.]|nr:sortase B protein-sorting domain-containing protein [Chryseobacterium sp.]
MYSRLFLISSMYLIKRYRR